MHLVSREAGKLVAELEDARLAGFEKEADVAVVYDRHAFVLCCLLGGELDMGVHPSLEDGERRRSKSANKYLLAHLGATLVFQIDQDRAPCPSGENNFIGKVFRSVCRFDSDTC